MKIGDGAGADDGCCEIRGDSVGNSDRYSDGSNDGGDVVIDDSGDSVDISDGVDVGLDDFNDVNIDDGCIVSEDSVGSNEGSKDGDIDGNDDVSRLNGDSVGADVNNDDNDCVTNSIFPSIIFAGVCRVFSINILRVGSLFTLNISTFKALVI